MRWSAFRRALLGSPSLVALATLVPGAEAVYAGPWPPAFPSVAVNDPTDDPGANNTQSATSVVLGSPGTVLVAFTDSGENSGDSRLTGWARSTDGGATFTDLGAFTSANNDAGNPHLARNAATGRIYASTYAWTSGGLKTFPSSDDGQTWQAPGTALAAACESQCDTPTIAVDSFAGASLGHAYVAGRSFGAAPGIYLARSTDNGSSWSAGTLVVAPAGANVQGPAIAVGADHAVYVAYYDRNPLAIRLRKSTDGGATFGAELQAAELLSTGVNGELGLGFRTTAFPRFVAHPANANELFIAFADDADGVDRGDIYLTRSTDGGATWSAKARVNADAGTNDQFTPGLAISPSGTTLFVGWYDRRDDGGNVLVRYYGRMARLGGALEFAPEFPISEAGWTPCNGLDPTINPTYLVDFDRPAADATYFYSAFLDCTTGNPDVRLSRIQIELFGDGLESGGTGRWSSFSP